MCSLFCTETQEELRLARLQKLRGGAGGGSAAATSAAAAAAPSSVSLEAVPAAPRAATDSAVSTSTASTGAPADAALAPVALRPASVSAPAGMSSSTVSTDSSSLSSASVSSAAASAAASAGFVPQPDLLAQLLAFDFDRGKACRALEATGNASISAAVDWMVMHESSSGSGAHAPAQAASAPTLPLPKQHFPSPSSGSSAGGSGAFASDAAAAGAARSAVEAMASDDRAAARLCAETIVTLCNNALREPGNPKFQQVKLDNEKIQERLVRVKGGVDAMQSGGWTKDEAAKLLRLTDAAAAAPRLRAVVGELQSALAPGGRLAL